MRALLACLYLMNLVIILMMCLRRGGVIVRRDERGVGVDIDIIVVIKSEEEVEREEIENMIGENIVDHAQDQVLDLDLDLKKENI